MVPEEQSTIAVIPRSASTNGDSVGYTAVAWAMMSIVSVLAVEKARMASMLRNWNACTDKPV